MPDQHTLKPAAPPPRVVPGLVEAVAVPAAQAILARGNCFLMGWAVRNTSSTALAAFSLYDATTDNVPGNLDVIPLNLYYNESNREWFGPQGIWLQIGCVYNPELGSVTGSVFIAYPVRRS